MTIKIAQSTNPDPSLAASELKATIGDLEPRFVLFFASSVYDANGLGAALADKFGTVPSIGCTTAGEMVSGQMLKNSVVLAALDAASLKSGRIVSVADPTSEGAVEQALDAIAAAAGTSPAALDPSRYVGIVLHDGLASAEEHVMSVLSARTNVAFVGGSAGDDAKFEQTLVFSDFQAATGASVLALLEPVEPFAILKTQSFQSTDRVLEVTEVDEATRTVKRFNGKPAAEEYAAQLGVPVAELPKHFQHHPVGLLMPDGEPYVRSPQRVSGTDVVFYCRVLPGMKLHVLESHNIVEETQRNLNAKLEEFGSCSAIINFNCILRTLELEATGQCDAYGAVFDRVPMIGFSTYGESYIGHINQTSTMLLLR